MLIFLFPLLISLSSLLMAYLRVDRSVYSRHSKTYMKKHKKSIKNKLFFIDLKEAVHPLSLIILYFNYLVTVLCVLSFFLSPFFEEGYTFAFAVTVSLCALVIEFFIGVIQRFIEIGESTHPLKIAAVVSLAFVTLVGFSFFIIDFLDVDFSYIFFGT